MGDVEGMRSWRRVDGRGASIGRFARTAGGWTVHGVEVLTGAEPLSCSFRIDLDGDWRTTAAEVRTVDAAGERTVQLARDGDAWTLDGAPAPALHGCEDIDVAATPVTNTFPIRRLTSLRPGEQRTLPVAWVDVPELSVHRVEQTYDRIGSLGWRYRDDAHGAFFLEVDDAGVVERYEGFAERAD